MNRSIFLFQWSFCFFVQTLTVLPLAAQFEVSVNRPDAIYKVNDTVFFQIKATLSGVATYELIYDDRVPVIETGTINVNGGQITSIPFTSNEPGVIICRVNLNGTIQEGAAAFAPLDISPLEEEPNDFDAFWNSQRNLKNNLPIDPQIAYHSESDYQITYTFSLANIENRRTYGYISVPKGAGPFPASISLPPYGSSNAVVGADTESAEKGGMIAVSLSIHNSPLNQDDQNAYKPDDNSDKNKFYYRYALIGAMHVIDYLETRADFNGNVVAMGVSQGGGLATILAGIDNRIDLLICSNPIMGQHVGYKYNRASGFPYYLSIIDNQNQGNTAIFNQAVNASKYYDAMFHARRVNGATLLLTGLNDMVVPSATAMVSFNQLPNNKVLIISRDGGHGHPNEYWNGRFEMMRRFILGADNPPFPYGPTNKGFIAHAGMDQTVEGSANLAGEIYYDNDQLNNLNVSWRKVRGPGAVNFSNKNGYNTSASFSSNGRYVLQFVGQDDRKLNDEGKVYFISDEVIVDVTNTENPTFTLNFVCPNDQTVQIPAGQSQITVFWEEPAVSSNCDGGANYFQLSALQNGNSFTEGIYNISYRATDNCGNQKDCNFTVTVSETIVDNSEIIINCPTDITVATSLGDNAVAVSWVEPTASTTCGATGNSNGGDCSTTLKNGFSYLGTFDNSQFYLSNDNKNWIDAKAAAEMQGGYLTIINSAAENDFIQENLNNEIAFIGLSDVEQEGNLKWVDGNFVNFSKYVSSLNNNQNKDFVTIYPWNGEWDLNNQFVTKKYLLEVPCSSENNTNETIVNQTNGGANGSDFSIGTTVISYLVIDDCGNSKTCSFKINVVETPTELSLSCSADRIFQIPASENQIQVNWEEPTVITNCLNGMTLLQTSGPSNFSELIAGIYSIAYQATDECGHTQNCSFQITVNQIQSALAISCPPDLTIDIPIGQSSVILNWNDPTTNSDCNGNIALNQVSGTPKFKLVGAGVYPISYEAVDNCQNKEICSFIVKVKEPEHTFLSITCPLNQTLQLPNGQSEMSITWADPITASSCPNNEVNLGQIDGPSKSSVLGVGKYVIAYEATDICGNRETCSFIIEVEDNNSNPTGNINLACPDDITINIPYNQSESTAFWLTPNATTTCTTSGGNDCNDNFINGYNYLGEFEGSRYYKSIEPFSFPLARTAAEKEGGFLAKITSEAENEFLYQNIGKDLCIIGLNDEAAEGTWQWADGTFPNYLNFPDNISNTDVYDYAVINFWNGEWELTASYIYKRYILEIPCGSGGDNPGSVNLTQIEGPASGSNFGIGTNIITYEATDDCGNIATCSFSVSVTQDNPPATDAPPSVTVSVAKAMISDDFEVIIEFSEPVTGLSGYDLAISNADWFNFKRENSALYTVIISPIEEGNVSVSIPAGVAFDSSIQGNIASNIITVNYQQDNTTNPPPMNNSCLIKPNSVTIESGKTVGGAVNNIISGDGLSNENEVDANHGGGNLYEGVWLNDGTDPTLRFDLGDAQIIDGIAIWNYSYHTWLALKRRGIKDFLISTSEDGINFTSTTFYSAVQTTNSGEKEKSQIFNFKAVTARYVRLQILNALDDSFYVGIGEVRFTNNCPQTAQTRGNNSQFNWLEDYDKNIQGASIISAEAFPNPINNKVYLNITAPRQSKANIQVINEVGIIIQEKTFITTEREPIAIDLFKEADGLFFIKIIIDNELPIIKRIIKTSKF